MPIRKIRILSRLLSAAAGIHFLASAAAALFQKNLAFLAGLFRWGGLLWGLLLCVCTLLIVLKLAYARRRKKVLAAMAAGLLASMFLFCAGYGMSLQAWALHRAAASAGWWSIWWLASFASDLACMLSCWIGCVFLKKRPLQKEVLEAA